MPAYLLLLVALLSRFLPHAGCGTLRVSGALLYFGARRPWREMLAPLAALMAADYILTVYIYHFAFRWEGYLPTWAWYLAAMALGQILLKTRTSFVRVGAGALLGPTSFFVLSNYAVWAGGGLYPRTQGGLMACYVAGSVLSQRPAVDRPGCRAGLRSSGAGAADERGADAAGRGRQVVSGFPTLAVKQETRQGRGAGFSRISRKHASYRISWR